MLTTTKTNINIINNNNNNNNDNSSIITQVSLQIDAHENIDEQNNSVTKELMNSTLIIKEFGIWFNKIIRQRPQKYQKNCKI